MFAKKLLKYSLIINIALIAYVAWIEYGDNWFVVKNNDSTATNATKEQRHKPQQIPQNALKPQLQTSLERDLMGGYILRLQVNNFQFAGPPQDAIDMSDLNEIIMNANGIVSGHAHIFINGKKSQRLYATTAHLNDDLFYPNGDNQITVRLSNHNHSDFLIDGKPILSTIIFNSKNNRLTIKSTFNSFGK